MRSVFMMGCALLVGACANLAAAEAEPPCAATRFDGATFTVCTLPLESFEIRLHLKTEEGELIGQPAWLEERLAERGERLLLAMNGGMYHIDRSPVGLYVEAGEEITPLVRGDGPGNFQLLPNGVFWIEGAQAGVTETEAWHGTERSPDYATQSGPMLVIDGELHPAFRESSDSVFRRNGVGVSDDGATVYLAISERPVNLHHFARLFRDEIGVDQALYLDGKISRLDIPAEGRREFGLSMGPIVSVVDRSKPSAE